MKIKLDDLCGVEIADFLEEHITEMKAVSSPESKHALDLDGLKTPAITFWTVWDEDNLVGCGAIKELSTEQAELKSMRTKASYRGRGIASMLLLHILPEAKQRGYSHINLETGSMSFFKPARNFYTKYGFEYCKPFSTYKEDANSVFMTRTL